MFRRGACTRASPVRMPRRLVASGWREGSCSPLQIDIGDSVATHEPGIIAVIFVSQRSGADAEGYASAAAVMVELASRQPGFRGVDSVRDADGLGITVSYWADDAAAIAWRDNLEHRAIREAGRGRWYTRYDLHVAAVTRSYDWAKQA